MITKEQISRAAKLYAAERLFINDGNPEIDFCNGVGWAVKKIDPLCTSAAEIIEKLQAENARLREVLEIARRYATVEYGESAACRIIASEIHAVFPAQQ